MDGRSCLPECCICTESLEDPRQLPCGHCYCGPHKTCLEFLKIGNAYKCAICKTDHQIIIADLKPLCGVRDYLKNQQDAGRETSIKRASILFCNYHPKKEVKFWCTNCEFTLCVECTDCDVHSDHYFISFSKNFDKLKEKQLKKISNELEALSSSLDSKQEKLRQKAQEIEMEIESVLTAKAANDKQLIQIKHYVDKPNLEIDANFFQRLFRSEVGHVGSEKNGSDFSSKEDLNKQTVASQTVYETVVDESTQTFHLKTIESQSQTDERRNDLPPCEVERSAKAVRPETIAQALRPARIKSNLERKKDEKVGTNTPDLFLGCSSIFIPKLLPPMPSFPCNPMGGNSLSSKLMRMDRLSQKDVKMRPDSDFMYDNHYLSIADINTIDIIFPYEANLQWNVELASQYLVNSCCIFQLRIGRQNNNKLSVSIVTIGAVHNKMFTVYLRTSTGPCYLVWKNQELIDGEEKITTLLDWFNLPVKRRTNSPSVITAIIAFWDKVDPLM